MNAEETKLSDGLILNHWDDIASPFAQLYLETEILPTYLPARRWFGSKGKQISRVSIAERAIIPTDNQPTCLWLLDVVYTDGSADHYLLPICFMLERKLPEEQMRPPLLCKVTIGIARGWLCDGTWCEDFRMAMFRMFARHANVHTDVSNELKFQASQRFPQQGRDIESSRILHAEQSNTSIIYGRSFFLKLYRKVEFGTNPDIELSKFLTEDTDFDQTPAWTGSIRWTSPSGTVDVAILQELVPDSTEGWSYVLTKMRNAVREIRAGKNHQHTTLPSVLNDARKLGELTADMHRALSSHNELVAFITEKFGHDQLKNLVDDVRREVNNAFHLLRENVRRLPITARPRAAELLTLEEDVHHMLMDMDASVFSTKIMRVHGDFHLGQILVSGSKFFVTDFEGEPGRPYAERRTKQSPMKDVAGMIRSFQYAVFGAVLLDEECDTAARFEELMPRLRELSHAIEEQYLGSYQRSLANSRLLPASSQDFRTLLRLFLLDKALYELKYELNNRPDWVVIPVTGLIAIVREWMESGVQHA